MPSGADDEGRLALEDARRPSVGLRLEASLHDPAALAAHLVDEAGRRMLQPVAAAEIFDALGPRRAAERPGHRHLLVALGDGGVTLPA